MADQTAAPDFDSLVAQYGAAKAPATPAASFDELVAQHAPPPKRSDQGPMSGPGWDAYFDADRAFSQTASPAAAHILDAFGQGAKQSWGSEPVGLSPETEKALRDHGAFNDYQKGEFNSGKALNEALFRPLATTVEAGFRGMRAVIGGGLAAIEQTGKEFEVPRLGREAAAVGEYLTQRADVFAPSMATLAKARDLGVIGEGESGWKGTADQTAAVEEARNRLRPSQETDEARPSPESAAAPAAAAAPTAPNTPATPPDIHAMAREIDPGTFREYDALSQRKDTFSRWIDELRDTRDQAATADLDKQIAEQQARLDGATGKKAATYRDRLETLNDQREQALEDARAKDSPDMARIRQQLQQTDYRMRDLAPDVTKAYRAAQEHMPEAAAPEATAPEATPPAPAAAPAAAAAPAPAETAAPAEASPAPAPVAAEAPTAPHIDIAADVAQKLTAAGRPAEEANAVSALYAARYDARAARLGTTAQDLYGKQPLNVEAGGRGRKGEMGRTVLKDGRATIRLMGNADASTFMHETGHQWLEELTGDAKDERATPQTKQDAQTVRDWLGNDGGAITTGQHEKFARGFERYLMEGRAPTQALAGVFGQFKDWLTKIYETVAKLRAPITDDIRDVFDRLIAKEPEGRGTVVAPEREPELALGDKHEALAEKTPPEQSDTVADTVRAEADADAKAHVPEVADEIGAGVAGEARGNAPQGAKSDGDRVAPGTLPGEARGGAAPRALGEGGGEAAPQGAGARPEARVSRSPFEKVPREPQRLLSFLRTAGGLKDQSGEISTILGGINKRPGLINNKAGLTLDEAARRAWEHGFVGTRGGERPSVGDFLEAVEHDARGNPRYSAEDEAAVARHNEALNRNAEIDRLAKHYDIDHRAMSRDEFFAKLSERASFEDRAKEIQSQTEAHEAALQEAEDRAAEGHGDAYEPPPDRGNVPSRTLEDIDHERRGEEEAASRTGSGAGVAVASRPGSAGAGEAGARQRGRGAGPAGPHDTIPDSDSRLVDKAGNIRLDNLNTPEDVSSVIRDTADQNGGFIGARRGVISDQQVLDLADALGMDATSVLKRNVGQAFNAEQVVQARKLLIHSAMTVREAAAKAAEGSDADLLAYAQAADRHRMIQEQVAGITAEAGRALRAFRAIDGSKEAAAIGDVLRSVTGRTLFQIRRAAAKVSELDTAAKISKFERDAARTGVFDWIQSVFINALISGPFTHAGYTAAGEMFGLFRAVGETSASAVVGKFRELTGLGEAEYAHIGEMPAQLYGMARGARNGTKAAWAAIKSNQIVLPAEVNEFLAEAKGVHGSETGQSVNPRAIIPNPTVAGRTIPVGTVLESPGRMVAALHSFNWTTFYSQSVAGQAFRQAMKEKLEGEAFSSRVADLTQSPTKEMIQEGINDANSGALMQRPAYDSLMGRVSQLTNFGVKLPDVPLPGGKSIPLGTLRPLKYIDPFVQIQANIQKTAFGRGTPLALFSQAVRDDLAMKNGGVAFDRTAGKILAGTSFMVAAGSLAAQGILNPSGPSDPRQARAWTRIHGQPHGLTVGDMSYNVLRLGNLGMQMSVAADLYHAVHQIGRDDAGKIAADLVHAFSQNIIDESSMRGPADLMRAIDEHDRHGAAWIRNFASSAVPFSVGLSQLAHQFDPYSRQARTTMDAIKAKLPGVSETLFPRRDVWGEPVPSGGWMVTYRQKIVGDHTDDVLYNLGIYPTVAPRRVRGVELTDQQYDDFARISGRAAKMSVDRVVNSPGFSSMPQGVQIELIDRGVKAGREQAASLVMMQSMGTANDIVAKAAKAKTAKLTGTK